MPPPLTGHHGRLTKAPIVAQEGAMRLAALAAVLVLGAPARAADDYKLGPDSLPKPGVPRGTLTQHRLTSRIFPGTVRDYWVYVPAQYDGKQPACVMVFQDGSGMIKPDGNWRTPTVLDNLIAARQMPITVGVFVNPGVLPPSTPAALPRYNRSVEYDGLGPDYARFLLDELLPEVAKSLNLSADPECRGLAGSSSGAIAAFTAAWERPDAFRRVFSAIGTFVGLRGGDAYPVLVRKTEPKPLRVFLQDGSNDQNIYGGDWFLSNQQMFSALEFAGYEVDHAWGDGGHTGKHGGAILPDALRWLWKDYPQRKIAAGTDARQPVMEVLIPGEGWTLVGEGYHFTEGPTANDKGELFFSDGKSNRIHKVSGGAVTVFAENAGGANGMAFGPDGRLYVAQSARQRVVAYDAAGKESIVAEGLEPNDLTVSHAGNVYVTDPSHKQLWLVDKKRGKRVVDTGITFPNGVALTPDQSQLYVADTRGRFVYALQVQADGTLANKEAFCHLHVPDGQNDSGADGLKVDADGRLYVATHLGVQICDQTGRVVGIIARPPGRWLANIAFGGPGLDELYATVTDKVWRRRTKARGVLPAQAPLTPPKPHL
jgi:sugar lactone lactonase YvrE/enterochelin esterase-like enzyme